MISRYRDAGTETVTRKRMSNEALDILLKSMQRQTPIVRIWKRSLIKAYVSHIVKDERGVTVTYVHTGGPIEGGFAEAAL
jgi:hypothetical protein